MPLAACRSPVAGRRSPRIRTLDELIRLLRENAVQRLADIRRFPGTRRYPHFLRETLQASLLALVEDDHLVYKNRNLTLGD